MPQELALGVAAIGHHHQVPVRQPPAQADQHLLGVVGDHLVPATFAPVVAGRHHQRGQKRQRPVSTRPPDTRQQHQAHPLQSGGHHHLVVGGPHRIPIPPLGRNLPAPASFHGLVNAEHQRLGGRTKAPGHQQRQHPAQLPRRPSGAVEHVVIDGEVAVLPNPQDVEGGGHGAFAGRQDRSHGQELGFAPGPGVKQALKGQQQGYYDCGQGRHARPLVVIWSSLPCSYNLSSFCTKSREGLVELTHQPGLQPPGILTEESP